MHFLETENAGTVLIWNVLQSPPLAVFSSCESLGKGGHFLCHHGLSLGVKTEPENDTQESSDSFIPS